MEFQAQASVLIYVSSGRCVRGIQNEMPFSPRYRVPCNKQTEHHATFFNKEASDLKKRSRIALGRLENRIPGIEEFFCMKSEMQVKNGIAMTKKKTVAEKPQKEVPATKPLKKVAGKPEKNRPARTLKTATAVPSPVADAPKPPALPAESKPKLPKNPAKINRESFTITIEDISLRAYFIAERRKIHGLHGDETADWVEAERQLLIEAAKKLS